MKSILTLLAFVALVSVSNSAQADVCTARLLNPRGMTVQTFTGHGYDRYEACRRAESQCQNELWRRPFPRAGARCDVNYRRPGPRPSRRTCTFEIQGRSRVLDVITSHGYDRMDACRNARRKCQNELSRMQRQGRAYNAYCVRRGGRPGPGPGRLITKSCAVERVGGRGTLHQRHTATASGYDSYTVEQRACSQAMGQCQRAVRGYQTCRRTRW